MVWRRTSAEAKDHDGPSRRRQMMERLDRDTPIGLLAYDQGEPVAWVSVAPRETYRNLGGPPAKEGEAIWSLACFFVRRKLRGQGMTRRLIAAAVDHARGEGATIVEAYPVDEAAPSYRFMGFVGVFAAAGFSDEGMAGHPTPRHASFASLAALSGRELRRIPRRARRGRACRRGTARARSRARTGARPPRPARPRVRPSLRIASTSAS